MEGGSGVAIEDRGGRGKGKSKRNILYIKRPSPILDLYMESVHQVINLHLWSITENFDNFQNS